MSELTNTLTLLATVGSGLAGGIFFAFSNFVMRALKQLPDNQGYTAMREINITVLNPWFFLAFFGTGGICGLVALLALRNPVDTTQILMLAGAATYILGCLLVTGARNVPLNNRLASVSPTSPEAIEAWAHYLPHWTRWNHIRTASCLVASALLGVSLLL